MGLTSIPRIKKCSCKGCDNLALAVDGKCLNHTTKGVYSAWTITDTTGIKNPFGVELECLCRELDVRRIAHCVTGDGSLPAHGHEIKILDEAHRIGQVAALTARKATRMGATINKKCGFHVHMSMNYPGRLISSTIREVARTIEPVVTSIQEEAFSLFPTRQGNTYCRSTLRDDVCSHYCWLSLSGKFKTLECRIHPGTLSAGKIISWIQVCRGLQKLFQNVIDGEETEIVKRAKDGNFIRLFRKGSIARKYLDSRQAANGRLTSYRVS